MPFTPKKAPGHAPTKITNRNGLNNGQKMPAQGVGKSLNNPNKMARGSQEKYIVEKTRTVAIAQLRKAEYDLSKDFSYNRVQYLIEKNRENFLEFLSKQNSEAKKEEEFTMTSRHPMSGGNKAGVSSSLSGGFQYGH